MKNTFWSVILILLTAVVSSAQTSLYLPQFVDGRPDANSLSWGTIIYVTNPASLGSGSATVTIALTKDSGTALNLPFTDETGTPVNNTFQVTGGQTKYLFSPSNGHPLIPLNVGYATVTSSLPVNAGLIFIEYAAGGGNPISEAGVPTALPLTRQVIPAVQMTNPLPGTYAVSTGVAVANPGSSPATVTFQLLNGTGGAVAVSATRTLDGYNHTAFFVSELFPSAPSTVFGSMRITSDLPIVTTALVFTGPGLFSTLPVLPLP